MIGGYYWKALRAAFDCVRVTLVAGACAIMLVTVTASVHADEPAEPRAGIAACEVARPTGDFAQVVLRLTTEPDDRRRESMQWTYAGAARNGRLRVEDGVGLCEPGGFLDLREGKLTGRFRRVDLGAEVTVDATVAAGVIKGSAMVGPSRARASGWVVTEDELADGNAVASDKSWPAAQGPLMGGCSSQWTGQATIDDPSLMRMVWRSEESDIGRGMGNITRFMHTWGSASRRRTGSGCASPLVADGKVFFKYYVPAPREANQPEMKHPNYGLTEAQGLARLLKEAKLDGFEGSKLPTYAAEKMYQNVNDVVVCMDAATGKTLWKAVVKKRPTEGTTHANSQHHKAGPFDMSPAYGGGRVFALGMTGWLYAFDAATGKPLWEVRSECDYSNALLAVGDVVIAPAARQWGGYDAKTGKLLWTAGRGRGVSTLSAWSHEGKAYVIGAMGPQHARSGIACLEASTGKQVWNLPVVVMSAGRGLGPGGISIHEDIMLVNQNNGTGKKGDPIDPVIAAYRLSPSGAELLWQLGRDEDEARAKAVLGRAVDRGPVHQECVPVVVRGKYVFTADLRVADLKTGKVLSKTTGIAPMNGGFMQAIEDIVLVRRDGTHGNMECAFYKIGEDGSVRRLTGDKAWVPPIGGTTTSYHHPLFYPMVDGRIFFRQENGVYCWDLRVKRAMKPQTIRFPPLPHQPEKAGEMEVRARASSSLPVDLRVIGGPAAAVDDGLRIDGTVGIVEVEARQPGDSDFLPAPPVRRVFCVGKPVPELPREVEAKGTASTVALLCWRHDGRHLAGFEIERRTDGRSWERVARVSGDERDLVDRGLRPSTTYRYRLRADNPFHRSAMTEPVSATTRQGDEARYLEAESAAVGAGWKVVKAEGASGGLALSAVNAPRSKAPEGPADIAGFTVDWPIAGPATVWVRGRSPFGGTSESGHVRVNGCPWSHLAFPTSGGWYWVALPFRFSDGECRVELGIREPRLQVDRFFITNGEARPK